MSTSPRKPRQPASSPELDPFLPDPSILAFLEAIPDSAFVIDRMGVILGANEAAAHLLGIASSDRLKGRSIRDFVLQAHRKTFAHYVEEAALGDPKTFENRVLETRIRRRNRPSVFIEANVGAAPVGNLVAVLFRDISKRKNLEVEVLRVAEEERRRMAADLHDSLCQEISAVHFGICSIRRLQDKDASPELQSLVQSVVGLAATALDHARSIAHGLSPLLGQGTSLELALKHLIQTQNELHPMKCSLHGSLDGRPFEEEVASQLYHIVSEALHNARKHASASHLEIQLKTTRKQITIRIRDNGTGLPDQEKLDQAAGRGLRFMRYRASQIGASLHLQSAPAGGTVIVCQLDDSKDT